MIQINKIEIRYFRSIYHLKLDNLTHANIFSGLNDAGKSNVLKALNLFFNNQTDWNTDFDFSRDFSKIRLSEVRKETIKGRQYIQIKVGFIRGDRHEKSLPKYFSVTKTWFRYSVNPDVKDDVADHFKNNRIETKNLSRALASFQRYLNTVKYEYIPAIKDQNYFNYILGQIQDTVFEKHSGTSSLATAISELNTMIKDELNELRNEFKSVTDVETDIQFPKQLDVLFRALFVDTLYGEDKIPLSLRGDGVRLRFLPSLLNYISLNSKHHYIWGFEEPENSLEHSLSSKLASNMIDSYSKHSQILITTHSPAFFCIRNEHTSIYRVFKELKRTAINCVYNAKYPAQSVNSASETLSIEMGLMEFQREQQEEYNKKLQSIDREREALIEIKEQIKQKSGPILLTEGICDKLILEEAWRKLTQGKPMPFRIIPCDPMELDNAGGAGGAKALKNGIESVRPDEPITIGLFDKDKEGIKNYNNLNNNFEEKKLNNINVKLQRTGTSSALLIPTFKTKEGYESAENLEIEFLFNDEFLNKKVKGKGLEWRQPIARTIVDGKIVKEEQATDSHYRKITRDTKIIFAKTVVPTFPVNAFVHFELLFVHINSIFKELVNRRKHFQSVAHNR